MIFHRSLFSIISWVRILTSACGRPRRMLNRTFCHLRSNDACPQSYPGELGNIWLLARCLQSDVLSLGNPVLAAYNGGCGSVPYPRLVFGCLFPCPPAHPVALALHLSVPAPCPVGAREGRRNERQEISRARALSACPASQSPATKVVIDHFPSFLMKAMR